MPAFLPSVELCREFYRHAVQPLLDEAYPGLPHAAARIGPGSDVLGFDTARSTDHDWGPRLELFLRPRDVDRYGADLSRLLSRRLPRRLLGFSTHFVPAEPPVRVMAPTDGPVDHRVQITDLGSWCRGQLGFAPGNLTTFDWLSTPTQRLAEVTGGAVYHDTLGELTALRHQLRWYPDDVWRYLLACQWARIGEEEPFVGRTAEAGDELGSRVLAGRLSRELMRLCLLLARRYPPYSKWLGTAFARLPGATRLAADLHAATGADDSRQRQGALCRAYRAVAAWQNSTGLAEACRETPRPFFNRPDLVLDAGRFTTALLDRISDPVLRTAPAVGGIDQYVDSTAVLCRLRLCRALMAGALSG